MTSAGSHDPARPGSPSLTELLAKAPGTVRAMALLRAHGVRTGGLVRFSGRAPRIRNDGELLIGELVLFEGHHGRTALTVDVGGRLEIGARTFVNSGVSITAEASVVIGADTRIAPHAQIADTSFHQTVPGEARKVAPVTIGRNAWIGYGAVVMPGTTIGDHAVVAASAVVRGDVPPCSIVAGVPARVVRTFDAPDDWVRV